MRKTILHAAAAAFPLCAASCIPAQTQAGYDKVLRESAALMPPPPRHARAASDTGAEAELAAQARLPAILRLALARNPQLREARERVRASAARVPAAGRLPDPELKYEQWAVPLDRPYALDKAGMLMLGVRQSFPAAGSLDAQGRAALHEAQMTLQMQRGRVRDLRAAVERAYFDYARADAEQRIRVDHERLAASILQLAHENYATGRGSQADVLRLQVELSRLHAEQSELAAQRRSAAALLNALMARPADARLGPPAATTAAQADLRESRLEAAMLRQRPEIASAERAVERSAAELSAAKQTAAWPSFMVGVDYWLMPQQSDPHAYGAMVSMSLPWLNPQHGEQVRAAEHALAAERSALEATRIDARYELRDAIARYRAARESFQIVDRELLAQTEQSYQASVAAFAAGRGDALGALEALRVYLEVRLEHSRALARLQTALSDVERTVGNELMDISDVPSDVPADARKESTP